MSERTPAGTQARRVAAVRQSASPHPHSPHCAKQQPQHGVFRRKVPRPGSTGSRSSCRLDASSFGAPGLSSGGTATVCASVLGSSLLSVPGRMCHVHFSIAMPLCSALSVTCTPRMHTRVEEQPP